MPGSHVPSPAPGTAFPPFGALNYVRVVMALAWLVVGPMVASIWLDTLLPRHELIGWALRLVWAGPCTLAAGLVLWPPTWLVCRRSPAAPVAAMFAVLYTPFAGFQLLTTLDVALDAAPGRTVQVRYVRHERHAKGPDTDVVTGWDDPTDTVCLSHTLIRGDARTPGAMVTLTVHRGALGVTWVEPDPIFR